MVRGPQMAFSWRALMVLTYFIVLEFFSYLESIR